MGANLMLAFYGLFLIRLSFNSLNSEGKRNGYPSILKTFKGDKGWIFYKKIARVIDIIISFLLILFLYLSTKATFQAPVLIGLAAAFIVYEIAMFLFRSIVRKQSCSIEEYIEKILKLDNNTKWIEVIKTIGIFTITVKPLIESLTHT